MCILNRQNVSRTRQRMFWFVAPYVSLALKVFENVRILNENDCLYFIVTWICWNNISLCFGRYVLNNYSWTKHFTTLCRCVCVGLVKVWFSVATAHWPRLWAFYLIHIYRCRALFILDASDIFWQGFPSLHAVNTVSLYFPNGLLCLWQVKTKNT